MVAAWIRADTGVGPAIASGNQVYSGICAALSGCAHKQQQRNHGKEPGGCFRSLLKYFSKGSGAKLIDHGKYRNQETKIPDAVHDKSFLGRTAVFLVFKPVTDQQIGTESDALPADEQDHKIGSQHQQQHRKNKEVEVTEVFRIGRRILFMHIGSGINMDQKAHAGDDQQE